MPDKKFKKIRPFFLSRLIRGIKRALKTLISQQPEK